MAIRGSHRLPSVALPSFAYPQQLLDGSPSLDHLAQAVFVEIAHAALDGLLLDGGEVGIFADHFPQLIVDYEQLKNAGALEVAGAQARRAHFVVAAFRTRVGGAIEELDLVSRQVCL